MLDAALFDGFLLDGDAGGVPPAPVALDLKEAIVAALQADSSFTAIAGAIYPDVVPQTSSGPCVVYWITGSSHGTWLGGAGGIRRRTVQLEIQAATVAQVEALSEVLRNRFQGLVGSLSGLAISFVTYDGEADGYYEPIMGSDLGTHWKQVDYTFVYRESVPILS